MRWLIPVLYFTFFVALESHASIDIPKLPDIPDFNAIPVPNFEDGEIFVEKRCREIGGEAAVTKAKSAQKEVFECVKSLVNYTELREEIEEATPTGELDVVFKKYCRLSPKLRACVMNFTTDIEVCLRDDEQKNKQVISDITDSFINFICHKEGDRIALFIAEGGPECLSDKHEDIQDCVNRTVQTNKPENITFDDLQSLQDVKLPTLLIDEKACREFDILQICVVRSLEKCKEPTPANIINSMFNFVRKASPCDEYEVLKVTSNIASVHIPIVMFVLVSTFSTYFL